MISDSPHHPRRRLVALGLGLAAAATIATVLGAPSSGSVEESITELGVVAPIAFVAVYAALTVGLLPGAALSLAAGAIFGVGLGTVVTVLGATIGATLAFLIGRRLSRGSVEAITGGQLQRLDRHLAERGFASVLLVRLVPLVPFNALNYAAGATGLRLRDYVGGTVIGILPGSVAFTAAGDGAGSPGSPLFIGALVALALLTLGGSVAARRTRRQA